ncbi:DUF4382 domain-containing protein [candidate division KSB1 bacterium]
MKIKFLLYLISLLLVFGCTEKSDSLVGSDDGITESVTGNLRMGITDAWVDISSLVIHISEIAIHKDDEWIVVDSVDHTVDLLLYNNGDVCDLLNSELEPGHYNQIRLMVDTATVVYEEQTYDLKIPSSMHTGLKLVNAFDVSAGTATSLILDFDVSRSVHMTGGQHHRTFQMTPTIRVIEENLSGRIRGDVSNLDTTAVAYAIAGQDTVATSPVKNSGVFVLAFLPENDYKVVVLDDSGRIYIEDPVAVTRGQITDLGEIVLN